MGRFGKTGCLCMAVLLMLCISKRIDASKLAIAFIFPNLAQIMEWSEEQLPITSEIEATVVEASKLTQLPETNDENELREQLAMENQLSFETLLEEEEIICQVEEDRKQLSNYCGYEVVGMAYPCGGENNNARVAKIIQERTGIKYARTITSTKNLDIFKNSIKD